jgi:hypothetical protein
LHGRCRNHDGFRPTSIETETGTGSPCQMSFIVIWLVTTTLSVVTTPLVEPRYFNVVRLHGIMDQLYCPKSTTVRIQTQFACWSSRTSLLLARFVPQPPTLLYRKAISLLLTSHRRSLIHSDSLYLTKEIEPKHQDHRRYVYYQPRIQHFFN